MRSSPSDATRDPGPRSAAARGIHALAVVAAAWTFALLFVGGLVTSHRAGLAVPDWPTSFEHYVNPPGWWTAVNVRLEHSHRLLGWVLGVLVLGLAVALQVAEPRRWMRRLGWIVVAAVGFQGLLGGGRVEWLMHWLAPVHGALAQAVFALMVSVAVFTSRSWTTDGTPGDGEAVARARRTALAAAIVVYLQVVVGAAVRHHLARSDEGGSPVTEAGDLFLVVLPHLVLGLLAAVVGLVAAAAARRVRGGGPALERPALLLAGGLVLQVLLGLGTYMAVHAGNAEVARPAYQTWTATVHQAAGSLVLAAAVVLLLRTRRLPGPGPVAAADASPAPAGAAA